MAQHDPHGETPPVSLAQLCYDIAYRILPRYAFEDLAKLQDLCRRTPSAAGPFFYVMASKMRGLEPDASAWRGFRWHLGELDRDHDYLALAYPTPPPIDLSERDLEGLLDSGPTIVLAPYYSAVIVRRRDEQVRFFNLGQAPMGGGTTFRGLTRDGMNCNLGPGPEPDLDAFLDTIRSKSSTPR